MQRRFRLSRYSVLVALFLGLSTTALTRFIDLATTRAAEPPGSLTIRVVGPRNAKGMIRAAVFNNAKGFPNNASEAVQTQAAVIDPQTLTATIVFTNVPEGIYAISVFHDENMNQKLDRSLWEYPRKGTALRTTRRKRWVRRTLKKQNSSSTERSP